MRRLTKQEGGTASPACAALECADIASGCRRADYQRRSSERVKCAPMASNAFHSLRARTAAFHAHAPVQNHAGIVGSVLAKIQLLVPLRAADDFAAHLNRYEAANGLPAWRLIGHGLAGTGEALYQAYPLGKPG